MLFIDPIPYDAGTAMEQQYIMTDMDEALKILIDQKALVIFHGKSEWLPKNIGNRSILFDPRNPDAKNIVKREED